jgi:quercetin 2,3-dioxygenase
LLRVEAGFLFKEYFMKKLNLVLYLTLVLCLQGQAQSIEDLRFFKADEVEEGDGAKVKRLIPQRKLKHLDPYVLFDDFTIHPPSGFPDHFHSGFEVITYLTAGQLEHKDSKGNQVVLNAGDVQCFTTGSGVVHSEMPKGTADVRGFQIWINLPKVDKQISPSYEVIRAKDISSVAVNSDVLVKTIVGQGATVRTRAELLINEITINANSKYKLVLPVGYQGFVYVTAGNLQLENKVYSAGEAVLFSSQNLEVSTTVKVSLLLVSGLPLGEPIHRKGSIVK